MDKDLKLLRLLVVLNEQRQTILAAKKLRLSQPTVSSMLKKLRLQFDDVLFIRNKNELEPTAKCEEILAQLPDIFERIDALYSNQSNWNISDLNDEIHLFFPAPLMSLIAPPLLEKLCASAPALTVECAIWSSDTAHIVEHERNSWGICYLPMEANKILLEKHLFDDHFMFVIRDGHPVSSNHLADVLNYPICVFSIPGFSEPSKAEMLIKRYKIKKNINARVNDMSTMLKLVESSEFIGITSHLYKHTLPEGFRTMPLPKELHSDTFRKQLSFFTNQRNQTNPLTKWIYNEMTSIIENIRQPY